VGDDALRAGVLTLLGTVLIAGDGPAAVMHLEEAVALREDQVGAGWVCRCEQQHHHNHPRGCQSALT
jgi:hypothetical protein